MTQQWISVKDRLPEKPGKKAYEHVYCLVFAPHEGIVVRPWNCEHLCWDDESGDDVCNLDQQITHWMPLPAPPGSDLELPESDPEVVGWLENVNTDLYDFVDPIAREMRCAGGTKAKMILAKAIEPFFKSGHSVCFSQWDTEGPASSGTPCTFKDNPPRVEPL